MANDDFVPGFDDETVDGLELRLEGIEGLEGLEGGLLVELKGFRQFFVFSGSLDEAGAHRCADCASALHVDETGEVFLG